MNYLRVKAICRKEFLQIKRDPRSLAMAFTLPVILIILFGYALTLDIDHVPVVVWDQDNTQISRDFILNFRDSRYFNIVGYADKYSTLQDYIDRRWALMAMVIPKDFSRYIQSEQPAPIQLLVDGSDSNTATIAIGYVNSIVGGYNVRYIKKVLARKGVKYVMPVDWQPRIWFNPDLESRNFIIPGLIAIIMMSISALLTSLTFCREWERGTMEQLISTPVRKGELIMGKFIPYFVIGFIDLVIIVAMGQFMFHVPLRGSLVLLFLLSGVFLSGALALGMFISIVARNQLMAVQMAILATMLPAVLLSGFVYAIFNMPVVIQFITHFIPARYFIVILKGIYLKGVGITVLWGQVVFLILFSVLMILLANIKFKKRVV